MRIFWCTAFFLAFASHSCRADGPECRAVKSSEFLKLAREFIDKAEESIPNCIDDPKPVDCEEVFRRGHNESGVFTIYPRSRILNCESIKVYCDMDTDGGGWTVIQRRGDFKRPEDYFFREWINYKTGFGDLEKDFWLGNDYIFALSNQRQYSVRFDLRAVDGESAYALYDSFWIDDEDRKYTLHIGDYSGTAGDSMINGHDNQTFSTKDQDNDKSESHCAEKYKGAWWYKSCYEANLNGLYKKGNYTGDTATGVTWKSWKGPWNSLKETEIKIRSRGFQKPFSQHPDSGV